MKRTPLKRRTPLGRGRSTLKTVGRRGRRLAAGDRRARRECKVDACVCGCGRRGPAVDWAHLDGRSEDVRHGPLTIPACRAFHEWLDHTAEGVSCRRELRQLARELATGQRLTAADVRPVAERHGYHEMEGTGR
jgi:hypothetical protein